MRLSCKQVDGKGLTNRPLPVVVIILCLAALATGLWLTWIEMKPLWGPSRTPQQLAPGALVVVLQGEYAGDVRTAFGFESSLVENRLSTSIAIPRSFVEGAGRVGIIDATSGQVSADCRGIPTDLAVSSREGPDTWEKAGYGDDFDTLPSGPSHITRDLGRTILHPSAFVEAAPPETLLDYTAGVRYVDSFGPLYVATDSSRYMVSDLSVDGSDSGSSILDLQIECQGDFSTAIANQDGSIAIGFIDTGVLVCSDNRCEAPQGKSSWSSAPAPLPVLLLYGSGETRLEQTLTTEQSSLGVARGPRALLADVDRQSSATRHLILIGLLMGVWASSIVSLLGWTLGQAINKIKAH